MSLLLAFKYWHPEGRMHEGLGRIAKGWGLRKIMLSKQKWGGRERRLNKQHCRGSHCQAPMALNGRQGYFSWHKM